MIKIIIADDHSIVREGMKLIISEIRDMTVCDEASNGNDLIEKVLQNQYDVAVLDISMPGPEILDIIKQIKKEKPSIRILILSMHPEEQYAVRVLKAGASGYLSKETAPAELVKAIRKVSSGKKYISPYFAENLADFLLSDNEKPVHTTLSDREYQVMCKIAAGEPVKDIARELCLSDKTISTYRSRILQKMNMTNNAELIHYAIKNTLI
ncbi:MAG: DNA-binding response regulator [Desulfobacterales bacterium CG23_combo_of_CG06-09_8_20_14_all_51_8]|nr:MAG: DNA-binding response regulator [Desulfobacterales bacterium CG23_combo_of_CG06-09_8_20_14_all_51_8]